MNIAEIERELQASNYVTGNLDELLNRIIELNKNGDYSLITKDDYDEKKTNNIKTVSILNRLLRANREQVTKKNIIDIIEFCNNEESLNRIIGFIKIIIINFNIEEIIEILECLINNQYIIHIDYMYGFIDYLIRKNKLDKMGLKKILDIFPDLDIKSFNESLIEGLNDDLIDVFSEYDIQIIDYIEESKITEKMLKTALTSEHYFLSERTPSVLKNNREFVKRAIKRYPESIRSDEKYFKDKELLEIAIENGLKLNYSEFYKYNIFDENILINKLENSFGFIKPIKREDGEVVGTFKFENIGDPETEKNDLEEIYNLLKYALDNNINISKTINFINANSNIFSSILHDFEDMNKDLTFMLSNQNFITSIIKTIGSKYANLITFTPDDKFAKEFYNAGFSIREIASKQVKESEILFKEAFNHKNYQIASAIKYGNNKFISQEYIDIAIAKGVDILANSLFEVTDPILKGKVENDISMIEEGDYKEFIKNIIKKAGYSIYYVEKDSILSKKSFEIFGENLITKIVRNLCFCGYRLDFKKLIDNNKLESFKEFYLKEKTNDDVLELKYLYEFFVDNYELIENLYSEEMSAEEKEGFKEYIHHRDKFFIIKSRNYLSNINLTIYQVNNRLIDENCDNVVLKKIIFSTLFDLAYNDIDNLIGLIGSKRIINLNNSIKDNSYNDILESIMPYMDFIEYIYYMYDYDKLKEIAINCNQFYFKFNDNVKKIKELMSNIEKIAKVLYTEELNSKLTKLTGDDYIEFSDDSFFLAHVMNAFGSGSKLSDFKNPRFIGKTYICLSAIGRGVYPYKRKEKDMNHVTLLFNNIPANSLISMSSEDMYSQGDNGAVDVSVTNNFDTLYNILDKTKGIPNEYVVYRESENGIVLYPCGVLVVGDRPSEPEMEAAKYLNVPLIKRNEKIMKTNPDKKVKPSDQQQNQFGIEENQFYTYILSKVSIIDKENDTKIIE